MTFREIGLSEQVLEGLDAMGFSQPTPVQEKTMPAILEGNDIIACAQTGTGKTAAFLLPVINRIITQNMPGISTLVIAPTRELALQIDQQMEGLSYFTGLSSIAIYGGGDGMGFDQQKKALTGGTDIVIATPGKLISHLNLGYVDMSNLKHLILDEADRMLDMGFYEDLMRIVSFLPKERQSLMFSATMPPKIRELAKRLLKEPQEVNIAISKPAENVLQAAYHAHDHQKLDLLNHLLKGKDMNSVLIFSSTKKNTKKTEQMLKSEGYETASIHSDLLQEEREEVLLRFRSKKLKILVATDILSRGIDIKDIELVINFDVPQDPEDYVHRIGRTARAEASGVAITLVNEDDQLKFKRIKDLVGESLRSVPLPEHLGQGPDPEGYLKIKKKPRKFGSNHRGNKRFNSGKKGKR